VAVVRPTPQFTDYLVIPFWPRSVCIAADSAVRSAGFRCSRGVFYGSAMVALGVRGKEMGEKAMMPSPYEGRVEVVASALVVNQVGQVLFIKSPKWGEQWLLPGGHVDHGETIFEAAAREAKEETGLDVEPRYCVNIGELIFDPTFHRRAHLIFFHVLCQAKNEQVELGGTEISEYRWTKPEDILSSTLEGRARQTLENYLSGVKFVIGTKRWP